MPARSEIRNQFIERYRQLGALGRDRPRGSGLIPHNASVLNYPHHLVTLGFAELCEDSRNRAELLMDRTGAFDHLNAERRIDVLVNLANWRTREVNAGRFVPPSRPINLAVDLGFPDVQQTVWLVPSELDEVLKISSTPGQ